MHPLVLLTLQWQGIYLGFRQVWELLSLPEADILNNLREKKLNLSDDWVKWGERQIEMSKANSIQLIPFWHPHYPDGLKKLPRPPLMLACLGDTSQLLKPSLAVVGSRKVNFQSLRWMDRELGDFVSKNICSLASGGAIGVDQKVHRLSVLHGRPTICWLPSGLLDIYPGQLKPMISEVLNSRGVVISTYAPTQKMRKFHFVQRNQFIAATSLATLVIQAKRRSGTLITAKAAADFGKEVLVLPSSPLEEGLGGLDLICEGAQLVRDAEDLKKIVSGLMLEEFSPFHQPKA